MQSGHNSVRSVLLLNTGCEKIRKNLKIVLDKWWHLWYYIRALAGNHKAPHKTERKSRKNLENQEKSSWQELESVVKYKSSARRTVIERTPEETERNVGNSKIASKKTSKELEKSSWQSKKDVIQWKPTAKVDSAPCKLNNVKTWRAPWTMILVF